MKGSPQFINKMNKIKILNLIRNSGEISRADISKLSDISAPTVTRIVDSLIHDEKLVKEIGAGESKGGRKPTLVEFSALDNFVIGIDLGKTHIDGVLANLNAQTIHEERVEMDLVDGFDSIIAKTGEMICRLKDHPKVKNKNIFGIGMAVAGLINRYKNIVEFSPDFHWENVDIRNALQNHTNLPIIFDNVSRVMALGELWYGIGHTTKNFVVVNVGYGIGSGIIIEGKPLYGPYGMAGEFGHIVMEKNSKYKCECGNYGCLEALASGRAIADRTKQAIKDGQRSVLSDLANGNIDTINAKLVANACREGDQLAKEIFTDAVDNLGVAISNVIDLLGPEAVLIGGGVSQANDLIFDRVKEVIRENTVKTRSRNVKILPVTFGPKSATKGAIALILNEVLSLRYSKTLSINSNGG